MSKKEKFLERARQATNELAALYWFKRAGKNLEKEKKVKYVDGIIHETNRATKRKEKAIKKKEESRAKVKARLEYLKKIGVIKK